MSGDPGAIRTAAAAMRASGNGASSAADTLRTLDVESWDGWAAGAFRNRKAAIIADVDQQDNDPSEAAGILNGWANQMADADAAIADVQDRMRASWAALVALPPDLSVLPDLARAQRELTTLRFLRERGAIYAADRLYDLVASDTSDLSRLTWPPDGWPPPQSLQTVDLPASILDTATFDPADVAQGQIGDCYLIASLMSLMQTGEGDRLLRDNLEWDPDLNGYWVTLYDHGDPVRYFVDHAQAGGASENGSAGIVSIYEAAMNEHLTFNDLTDGGWPDDMFELLTGQDANVHSRAVTDEGWDSDALREDLDNGGHLVASTPSLNPDGEGVDIEVTRRTDSGDLVTSTAPVYGPHSYTVVSIDPDGSVWIRNPWGENDPNIQDGDGGFGTFRISAADFDRLFHNVASSGGS